MEQRTIAEVARSANVFSTAEATQAQRRQRLERLAQLLEAYEGPIYLLSRIEYVRSPERLLLRRDNSALTVAFNDPVFRAQGLASDRLGDAVEFFALSDREAHHAFCDCHYTVVPTSQTIAHQLRLLARKQSLGEIWHKAGRAISRLWS
jgi:hypothetical protein